MIASQGLCLLCTHISKFNLALQSFLPVQGGPHGSRVGWGGKGCALPAKALPCRVDRGTIFAARSPRECKRTRPLGQAGDQAQTSHCANLGVTG